MTYAIAAFGFVRWNGPPPQLVSEHLRTFTKGGQNGISAQALGVYGSPFDVELEAWFPDQLTAGASEDAYRYLVGSGPQLVLYNGFNYWPVFGHKYLILDVKTVEIKTVPRLIGPSIDYYGGWRLRSRWQMQPIT